MLSFFKKKISYLLVILTNTLESHINTVNVKIPFCSLVLKCLPASGTKIGHHQLAVYHAVKILSKKFLHQNLASEPPQNDSFT